MEDQNYTVTKSPTSAQTEPPGRSTGLDEAAKDADAVPDVMGAVGVQSVAGGKSETVCSEIGVKKRRGRPRKYDVNGHLVSPASAPTSISNYSLGSSVKRGRGRPRGSGKLQLLASIGGIVADTAGGSLIPHVVTVNTGEDVVSRILSFSLRGSRAICILSATGAVSSVIIRQSGCSGGVLRYEGRFEILSLTGSYTADGIGGGRRKSGTLSVSLAKPDGRVFGGGVEGSLIAAGPIQLIVGSFKQNISKEIRRRHPDSTTSGLVGTTNGFPDNVIPAITDGLPDNVITATSNGLRDDVIYGTTSGVPDNVIPMHSASSNGIGQDIQPIADPRI